MSQESLVEDEGIIELRKQFAFYVVPVENYLPRGKQTIWLKDQRTEFCVLLFSYTFMHLKKKEEIRKATIC